MVKYRAIKVLLGAVTVVTFALLLLPRCDAKTIEHARGDEAQRVVAPRPKLHPKAPAIDTRAKLIGLNRALAERLQHTRAALQPLQARAAKLQRRYRSVQSAAAVNPATVRAERHGLLQEALRLRASVERKLVGFGALERRYSNMRTLLNAEPANRTQGPTALPRAWLDRDTERQMELNERVYKNIIGLLVHLIECPVNIIHEMMGGGAGGGGGGPASPATTTTTSAPGGHEYSDEQLDDGALAADDDDLAPNAVYDAGETDDGPDGEPWLEEFHY